VVYLQIAVLPQYTVLPVTSRKLHFGCCVTKKREGGAGLRTADLEERRLDSSYDFPHIAAHLCSSLLLILFKP